MNHEHRVFAIGKVIAHHEAGIHQSADTQLAIPSLWDVTLNPHAMLCRVAADAFNYVVEELLRCAFFEEVVELIKVCQSLEPFVEGT